MTLTKTQARETEIIRKTTDVIRNRIKPHRIILFGSRAKGNARHGSDFDFAVDAPRPDGNTRRMIEGDIERFSGLYEVDVVYLPNVEDGFRQLVLSTGKVIYEQ
jgi:predicted nucleotidyltransferase